MSMKEMQRQSYLHGSNAAFIEELYSQYLKDESQVDENWRKWFAELRNGELSPDEDHLEIQAQMLAAVRQKGRGNGVAAQGAQPHEHDAKQVRVLQLINAYRVKGHQKARLDPLEMGSLPEIKEMSLAGNNLGEADLDTVFNPGSLFGVEEASLREIVDRLENTY